MNKKNFPIVVPLFCLIVSSCNSQNGPSSKSEKEFTYFDDKVYSSVVELEEDLFNNWMEPSDIYHGYYEIKDEMRRNEFGKNPSIRSLLMSSGKQFVYEMSTKKHLVDDEIVSLLLAADAFMVNKYAIYNCHNDETSFGAPIYFAHTWWGYDKWEYNHSGEYGWENSDVGKRILRDLSSFVNNSDYEVDDLHFYVTRNTYNLETYTFSGQAYAYVGVTRLSTKRTAYQKYSFDLESKTLLSMSAMRDYVTDASDNNLMSVY